MNILWFLLIIPALLIWNRWHASRYQLQSPTPLVSGKWFARSQGQGRYTVVLDSRLGGMCMEWWKIQDSLSPHAHVFCYDRLGYGWSGRAPDSRSTAQIAKELYELLKASQAPAPYILVGHSQGCLNLQHFARLYPKEVAGAVFLDPISVDNNRFQLELPTKVYAGSGVDKSAGIKTLSVLAQLGVLPWLKGLMMKSPPFFYYGDMPQERQEIIWQHHLHPNSYQTVSAEYAQAYTPKNKAELLEQPFPPIPIAVISHDPDVIVAEIVKYGGLPEAEAKQVEAVWDNLTRSYLKLSPQSRWLMAAKTSHMIHLEQPELVKNTVLEMISSFGHTTTAEVVRNT